MRLLRQSLKHLCQSTLPRQWMMFHGPRWARSIALTFDDGPHPEQTPRLLDELARRDVRASFFVVGEAADQHRDLIRRMHREGHALGHHTWTHADLSVMPVRLVLDEVRRCRELLESITGEPCNVFRPPRGHLTISKTCGLWQRGQQIVLWNVDPKDCDMRTSAEAIAWAKHYGPRGGDIVLLHDDHAQIIPLVSSLLDRIKTAGLTTATIADWT